MPKCKGKKANGDPCQVTVGLDENGYCWRCKIQSEDNKSGVHSPESRDSGSQTKDQGPGTRDSQNMAAGVTHTIDKDGKTIDIEYGEGPPASEFKTVTELEPQKDLVPPPDPKPRTPDSGLRTEQRPALPSKTLFWPEKKKLPETYDRRLYPCHECRRVRLNDGGQAVGIKSKSQGMVYLYCRECGATMAVPQDEKAMARKYTFEKKPPCTHCSSEDTKAYKTAGPVQYRVCNECKRTYPNRAIDPLSVERRSTIENIIRKCIQLEDTLSDKILEFIDTFYKNGKDGGDIWNDIRIRLNDLPDENIKNINSILEKEKKIISAPELRNFIREILVDKAGEAI